MCKDNSTDEMRKFIDIADELYGQNSASKSPEEKEMEVERIRLQINEGLEEQADNNSVFLNGDEEKSE